jgi:hypothetical protein
MVHVHGPSPAPSGSVNVAFIVYGLPTVASASAPALTDGTEFTGVAVAVTMALSV